MDDQELFKAAEVKAERGEIRAESYSKIPRGLHTLMIESSTLDKNEDTSRSITISGRVLDESPENGQAFQIRAQLTYKDGKKNERGLAVAAGLIKAAKDAGVPISYNFALSGGVKAVAWLDLEEYIKAGETKYSQVIHWGDKEPAKGAPPKRGASAAAASVDAPF